MLRAFTLWIQLRFINMQSHLVSSRLVESYLRQPYEWFLRHRSSDIGVNVLAEVTNVLQGAVYPVMLLFANGIVALLLVVLLVVVDPLLAAMVTVVIGGIYSGVFLVVRKYVERIGEVRVRANRERHHALQETFGGIKDIKVAGLESSFLDRFRAPSERMARSSVVAAVVSELPSFVMQAVVFGGMLLVMLYLIVSYGSLQDALPVISLYALAGYRLLPTLQSAYRNLTGLRFTLPAVESLHRDVMEFKRTASGNPDEQPEMGFSKPLGLRRMLELRGVGFRYAGSEHPVLKDICLTIRAYSTIALVGSTGSGKTTTVDLLLGLLRPTAGQLRVDDTPITGGNIRSWQRTIGYVPQSIFLADDSVAANIAFGIAPEKIDRDAVERAARIANLHDFVTAELPAGYDTAIGERGVRLSGGQRQRIGIARALYHDPELLIFDEATSALDSVTEQAVMEAVYTLGKKKTIVMIAHRLSTIRACDRIHVLDRGRIVAEGAYDELLATSEVFRSMATQSAHAATPPDERAAAADQALPAGLAG
jgi:ABC-type multidrug transport system fused ATPase/permease subunit